MKQKIIFLDIDGTLITDTEFVDQKVIDKVEELKANGWLVALATGRTVGQANDVIKALGIENGVFANGQTIMRNNQIIFQHTFSDEVSKNVFGLAKAFKLNSGFVTPNGIYLEAGIRGAVIKHKLRNYPFGGLKLKRITTEDVQGFWFFAEKESIEAFRKVIDNDFKVFQYGDKSIEVLPKEYNKMNGAQRFLKEFSTEVFTVTIGDGKNDIEIFELVDFSIAMENAVDELKAKANHITKSNYEHGVAHAIQFLMDEEY